VSVRPRRKRRTVSLPSTTLVALKVSSGPRPSRRDSRAGAAVLRVSPLAARFLTAVDPRTSLAARFATAPASIVGLERLIGRRVVSELSSSSSEEPPTMMTLPSLSVTAGCLGLTIAALALRRWRRSARTDVGEGARGTVMSARRLVKHGERKTETYEPPAGSQRCRRRVHHSHAMRHGPWPGSMLTLWCRPWVCRMCCDGACPRRRLRRARQRPEMNTMRQRISIGRRSHRARGQQ